MTETGKQIIALDRQRMTAMMRKDTATLNALLSDDLVYTHAMAARHEAGADRGH